MRREHDLGSQKQRIAANLLYTYYVDKRSHSSVIWLKGSKRKNQKNQNRQSLIKFKFSTNTYLFMIILCVTCQVLGPAAEWTLKQTVQFGNWVDSRNQLTEVERLNFERKRILIGIIHTI